MSILETPPLDHSPRLVSADPATFPLPTSRQEEWRFAPVDRLTAFMEPHEDWGQVTAGVGPYVSFADAPSSSWLPIDRPSAVARSCAKTVIRVDVPAEEIVETPIVLRLSASAASAYGHIEVSVGRHARATVVVVHDTGADISGSMVTNVADGADLTMLSVIDGPAVHDQLWQWPTTVGRDARFVGGCVTIGGRFVRVCPSVHYAAPGGSAELLGAFLVEGEQYAEHRVFVEHVEPHCTSNVIFKGALSGALAHSVWVGDVLVRRTATGVQTYELNRNLLLTEGPRADSVPNLELETGDVISAGHASATGRFDDEQLFYLQARGIPESVARQLIVRGFFAEILARIPSQEWRADVLHRIEQRLGMAQDEA